MRQRRMRQTVMVKPRGSGARMFAVGSLVDLDAYVSGLPIAEHFAGFVDDYTEPMEPETEAKPDVVDDVATRKKTKRSH